jgi:hypothetical protein
VLIPHLYCVIIKNNKAASGSSIIGKNKSTYRPEINGLRALALIAVIINHFEKSVLPSVFLGVDIFFVISGFVITSSLILRPRQSFRHRVLDFYAKKDQTVGADACHLHCGDQCLGLPV